MERFVDHPYYFQCSQSCFVNDNCFHFGEYLAGNRVPSSSALFMKCNFINTARVTF